LWCEGCWHHEAGRDEYWVCPECPLNALLSWERWIVLNRARARLLRLRGILGDSTTTGRYPKPYGPTEASPAP
jgi:hypothetical protein